MPKKELILGIDDAGRGPLIGPMALAGCLIPKDLEKEFKELGVRDSKTLTPKRREALAEMIREKSLKYEFVLAFPKKIDSSIQNGTNLNKVEAMEAAEIINKITKGVKEKVKVVIDCPSPNREAWKNQVLEFVEDVSNLEVFCEHKADRDYLVVSAASILAKSVRESEISKIKKRIGKDFGSGYPNDPLTKEFLEKYAEEHRNNGLFRESWATFRNHKKKNEQKNLFDF